MSLNSEKTIPEFQSSDTEYRLLQVVTRREGNETPSLFKTKLQLPRSPDTLNGKLLRHLAQYTSGELG